MKLIFNHKILYIRQKKANKYVGAGHMLLSSMYFDVLKPI